VMIPLAWGQDQRARTSVTTIQSVCEAVSNPRARNAAQIVCHCLALAAFGMTRSIVEGVNGLSMFALAAYARMRHIQVKHLPATHRSKNPLFHTREKRFAERVFI